MNSFWIQMKHYSEMNIDTVTNTKIYKIDNLPSPPNWIQMADITVLWLILHSQYLLILSSLLDNCINLLCKRFGWIAEVAYWKAGNEENSRPGMFLNSCSGCKILMNNLNSSAKLSFVFFPHVPSVMSADFAKAWSSVLPSAPTIWLWRYTVSDVMFPPASLRDSENIIKIPIYYYSNSICYA